MNIRKTFFLNNLMIFALVVLVSIGVGAAAEPAPESKIVILADDGQTITVMVNETFLLKLGEEYDWNITIEDQTIVSRVVNVLVVKGAQGLYRAKQEGHTTLTAVGDPVCRKARPPCGAPTRKFSIDIVVSGTPKTPGFGNFLVMLALMAALLARRMH